MNIVPTHGWCISAVCCLDIRDPDLGLAGVFLRASAERRQAIAAFLSQQPWALAAQKIGGNSVRDQRDVTKLLATGSSRSIIEAAFGECPTGLRGALARIGHQPEAADFYRALFRAMREPGDRSIARALMQVRVVNQEKLHILRRLPAPLRRPALIDQIQDFQAARDVAMSFDLLCIAGCDPKDVIASLKLVSRANTLQSWARRALETMAFPESPIPDSGRYVGVKNGRELRQIALRFRNCCRGLLIRALEGQSVLGLMTLSSSAEVLVHLQKSDATFVLDDVYRLRNRDCPPGWRSEALELLKPFGVIERRRKSAPPGKFAPLERLADIAAVWRWTI